MRCFSGVTPSMFPSELQADENTPTGGPEGRNLFCPAYSVCLNHAVMAGWDDWTCRRCPRFAISTGPSLEQFARSRRSDAE